MKIVQINTFSNKSTGNIMKQIHHYLQNNNCESYIIWGRGQKSISDNEIFLNDRIGVYFHALYSRITDKSGFASKRSTKKLIKKLDSIKPDIVHLHNVHGYYLNVEMLFNYFKKKNIKVVWTMHDCWAITGHCPHFEYVDCKKWETKCYQCPQINFYPKALVDNSTWNYNKKKELFSNLNLTIVTPSHWLKEVLRKSFMNNYNIRVINNGINNNVFKIKQSKFKEKHNIQDKKIILGVSSDWTERKGLQDFVKLAKSISNDYIIVLVGLNKNEIEKLPKNIIGIERTESQDELADIYNASEVFFNPTYEDTYPTVNLEAIACGTKVVTYGKCGSAEIINDKNGYVMTYEEFENNYSKINKNGIDSKVKTTEEMCYEYMNLYREVLK